MPCSLTLLSPHHGRLATKQVSSTGVRDIDETRLHTGIEVPLPDPDAFFAALPKLVASPAWYLVRGAILPGVDRANMRRAHKTDATLGEMARSWVLLDLDKYAPELDPAAFARDPGAVAAIARAALPEAFRGAQCFWAATSSAGIKPGARLRLAFWLARPVDNTEWRARLERRSGPDGKGAWYLGDVPIDSSLFTPSQPHFTAAPVFVDVPDPVPPGRRCGILPGTLAVELPPIVKARRAGDDTADAALARAVKKISALGEGERRNALNAAAFRLSCRYHEDDLPAARLERALMGAAAEAGLPDHETVITIQSAIRDGRAKRERERDGWRAGLARTKDDHVASTAANVSIYIDNHPFFKDRLALDLRAGCAVWTEPMPWREDGPYTDADTVEIVEWFQTQAELDARGTWVRDAVMRAAGRRSFDAVQVWLQSRPEWDSLERVDTFFIRHLGVEDTALTRAMTRAWFVQAARRPFATLTEPERADHMLVLVSPEQGIGKSTAVRALCPLPRFFRDNLPPLHDKDARVAVADAWIVELGEMTVRKSDMDTFKAFVTAVKDKIRRPYAREESEIPRRVVFVGTTNEEEFLSDVTGNRRFWPLFCSMRGDPSQIEAAVAAERDQVWAEAMHLAAAGAPAYLPRELETEANAHREDFRARSAEEDILRNVLAGPLDRSTMVREIEGERLVLSESGHVLGLSSVTAATLAGLEPTDHGAISRVGMALRALGWRAGKRRAVKRDSGWGSGARLWTPPEGWRYVTSAGDARKSEGIFQ